MNEVAIIGGGAAGFFAALSCKSHYPESKVTLYEKSGKLLSKVKVSGGGRCNVTNACEGVSAFAKHYPRGERHLKKALQVFSADDTVNWFESRGVQLVSEADKRIFPASNDSQTVIDCLLKEAGRLGVSIQMNAPVLALTKENGKFKLVTKNNQVVFVEKVIIATGGSPKMDGFTWLADLGHQIIPPVPSLFTFNMPDETVKSLMGMVVDPVSVRIQSTKLSSDGPLLITHWGMSGPAILKLSAWGARVLHELNYQFTIQINWLGDVKEDKLRESLPALLEPVLKRKVVNQNPFKLPSRFWDFILEKSEINPDTIWAELGKKSTNKLINNLLNDTYNVKGKTTFKEEFVTCGGVALSDIDIATMESKKLDGLYFAGEVLDIDGITGGFNFQAAWTTGYIAGKLGAAR